MKCYLCDKEKVTKFLLKNGYQLFRCQNCGLVFYDFKRDYYQFLKKQYAKGYFTGDSKLDSYFDYGKDKSNIVKNMRWYLKQISAFKKRGKWLDVGCAYGYLMEEAEKKGFEVFGIDPSDYAIGKAKEKFGQSAIQGALSQVSLPEKTFDVITMFDVFEHLNDPKKDLKKVSKSLKDDGLLVMTTGDTSSLWAKITGRRWTFYNPPQHVFYFNQHNVRKILEETRFKILKITTDGKWLSLRYVLHLARTVGESRLAEFFYSLVKNNFLGQIPLYLRLNDNMVIFAVKTHS